MSFNFPFCEFAEVDEGDVTSFYAGSSEDEIILSAGQRDKVVYLIFLKPEGFDDVLDFQVEQMDKKHFVVECYYDLIQSDFELLNL